jgi:hypothetical protein
MVNLGNPGISMTSPPCGVSDVGIAVSEGLETVGDGLEVGVGAVDDGSVKSVLGVSSVITGAFCCGAGMMGCATEASPPIECAVLAVPVNVVQPWSSSSLAPMPHDT